MKQIVRYAGFTMLMLGATLLFNGCNNNEAPKSELVATAYACPMDCEKGKTYSEPGQCPVCEMDLQELTVE
jgi:hypothetical protein